MKLFLASSADKTIHLLKKISPETGTRVLFIANAADPYDDQFWVEWDRVAFKKAGYQLTEVDLRKTDSKSFKQLLSDSDVLHVCGGSVSYLGLLLTDTGIAKVITEAIKNEQIVYTATSAGAMIVSEDLAMFSYDDEEKSEYIKRGFNKKGLGLVPWTIAPHSNQADFVESHKHVVDELLTNPTAVLLLHDNQAIWVENDAVKFVQA